MRAAGAPVAALDREEIGARIPLLAPEHPWDRAIWDPLAGSLRIRRTLRALAARVTVRRATVTAVGDDGVIADGERIAADAVLVCAGLGTQALVAPLGLDFALTVTPHVRVTYAAGAPAACVIAPGLYGLPLGSTGRYAISGAPDMFAPLAADRHGGVRLARARRGWTSAVTDSSRCGPAACSRSTRATS